MCLRPLRRLSGAPPGVPITLVPLDATNTIPVTEEFFGEFGRRWQTTPEARYCFQSLDQVLRRHRRPAPGLHGITVLNLPKQAGRFNISTVPIPQGGVLVNGNGWANIASIDIVYDILHMMGRDDIPVGLGNTTAMGNPTLGCNNVYAILQGSGGYIDLIYQVVWTARLLLRSPRRYTPESTDDTEHRQPLAFEVWQSVRRHLVQRVYVVGGLIRDEGHEKGNVHCSIEQICRIQHVS
ncbi:hypothetical protein ZWY2020_043277 [Hordeum vulgare]|nr:hypothetical protein ZWY2020_043277 [Hordeum vulgare]